MPATAQAIELPDIPLPLSLRLAREQPCDISPLEGVARYDAQQAATYDPVKQAGHLIEILGSSGGTTCPGICCLEYIGVDASVRDTVEDAG
jgi:hypothetical protein